YGFDPHEQATATYTGMGMDINVHDQWAIESMGPIQDRTREHLGQADKAIVEYRRMRREQIEHAASGETPIMCLDEAHAKSIQGPGTMDGIGPTQGWEMYWMDVDVKRRRGAPWASPVPAEIAEKVRHLSAAEGALYPSSRARCLGWAKARMRGAHRWPGLTSAGGHAEPVIGPRFARTRWLCPPYGFSQ